MSTRLKKIHYGRRRFLKSEPLANPEDWLLRINQLKSFISHNSKLQVVGHASTLECSEGRVCAMLEVIGKPFKTDQDAVHISDFEEHDLLVFEIEHFDLFSIDFDKIMLISASILKALSKKEDKPSSNFHLVIDQQKIELHFFSQKDYIQKQLKY